MCLIIVIFQEDEQGEEGYALPRPKGGFSRSVSTQYHHTCHLWPLSCHQLAHSSRAGLAVVDSCLRLLPSHAPALVPTTASHVSTCGTRTCPTGRESAIWRPQSVDSPSSPGLVAQW